ncbi:MAG: cation-translocating P-type ATPase [Brotaphodocola sp.]
MSEWHLITGEAVLRKLETSRAGLNVEEAEKRLYKHGANILKEEKRKNIAQVFLEQFQDLLVVILIAAAGISMISENVESAVVIMAVLLLNAVLGTIQHEKAQKSLDSLRAMSAPEARVIRNGRQVEILSSDVVLGDILLLEAGDLVAADGRLLESYSLMTDESSLTGESGSVEKRAEILSGCGQIPLAERANMVYSGSLVTSGRGVVVVTATGMNTEIGKIASMMNATDEKRTPLQMSLDDFSRKLAMVIMGICMLVFGLSLYRQMPILDSLMFAVALAVAAIPEALGSIVTIVQAMGTQQMARENAIIKDLKAVESLGCVSVICSDKTGTLTQNRMSVQEIWADGKKVLPYDINIYDPVHRYLMYASVLTNDAVVEQDAVTEKRLGDPTELALLEFGEQACVHTEQLRMSYPRIGEIPFDSQRKRMSTLHRIDGKILLFSKGAMDVLLERSDSILTSSGVHPMTVSWKQKVQRQNREWSGQGLRVIAMAYREFEGKSDSSTPLCGKEGMLNETLENHYSFLGMAAMMDPPRPESRAAVSNARRAGIRPVMITGDHPVTAMAIAEKIGLAKPGDLCISGPELDQMSNEELAEKLSRISVYARVSPEHKNRIVEAWQRRGNIVAMTGDGVNDAPALKKADIGVAMGITGTAVSKDAASMILTDDNFATIIKAVANGRNVYRNIRHAIQFLLSGNMAGIFCVLYTSLMGLPMPFVPVHLLFINLLTDSLPAIAIGMEPQEEGLLSMPPRNPGEGILTKNFLCQIFLQGGLIALCTMIAYHTGMETGAVGRASTMAFATLTLARLFHGFNCRSEHSIIRIGLRSNPWSILAFEAGVVLLMAVLFLPGLQVLFAVADLSRRQIRSIFVLALLPTLMIQSVKTVREALE